MSESKIYVGNLPYEVTSDQLQEFFAQYGEIEEVKLITDYATGRSKGFAFITFVSSEAAQNALNANDQDLGGRAMRVNIAQESNRRGDRGGRGGRGAGGGRRSFGSGNDRSRW